MDHLIEPFSLPLMMLDHDRIVMANAAAREALGRHILGQDVRVALRHPAAVALIDRKAGGSATVPGLTSARSIWQMTRHQIDDRYAMVELVNRTSEADISRAHTDFVANASHELRTPLASIIGYIETLVEEGANVEPELASCFHNTVLREARRMQHLVEDLMSLSRVEAEKHDQPNDTIELGRLVAVSARDAAGDRHERLKFAIPGEEVFVAGDRQQLEQLIRNLVDNALKYGAPKADVSIGLDVSERGDARVAVSDRGEGISPENVPHLTRRFYRTDPGRSRAAGGTGLGLAIVKHIVERHRGRLDIASRLGQGTTVTVRLPLSRDDDE